jgi:hypothetical protein
MIETQLEIIPFLYLTPEEISKIPEDISIQDLQNSFIKIQTNDHYEIDFYLNSGIKIEVIDFLIQCNKIKKVFVDLDPQNILSTIEYTEYKELQKKLKEAYSDWSFGSPRLKKSQKSINLQPIP